MVVRGFGWGLLACVACVVGVVLGGCGGSGSGGLPAGVVAAVGNHQVSLITLEHWARVEGELANEATSNAANPEWDKPDPPAYTGCIARLGPSGPARTPAVIAAARRACKASYHELQQKALAYLLRKIWDEEQAAEQHIRLTSTEVEREYQIFTRREYPEPGELGRMLAYSGMSVADEMLRIKQNMLQERLLLKAAPILRAAEGHGPAERAAQARITTIPEDRLLNKTNCRAGYVVEVCRQYRGNQRVTVKS
jgi:hypothetical protein